MPKSTSFYAVDYKTVNNPQIYSHVYAPGTEYYEIHPIVYYRNHFSSCPDGM